MFYYRPCFAPTLPSPQDVSFPLFDSIKPEHVVPGVKQLLGELHAEIDKWVWDKSGVGSGEVWVSVLRRWGWQQLLGELHAKMD